MKYLTLALLLLSDGIFAQSFSGNELYNYTHYNKDLGLTYNMSWYRRYHKGFFLELGTENINKRLDTAVGYQGLKGELLLDIKIGPDNTGTASVIKRF